MFAHAFIHGTFVAFITGYWYLGIMEVLIHFITDYAKCDGRINIHQDQAIHIAFKLAWAFWACYGYA